MLNILTPLVKLWRKPVKIDIDNFTSIVAGQWVEQTTQSGGTATIKNIVSGTRPSNPKLSMSGYSTSDYESQDVKGVERLTVIEGVGGIIEVDTDGFAVQDQAATPFTYNVGDDLQAAYDVGVGANKIVAADINKLMPVIVAGTDRVVAEVEYFDSVNNLLYAKLK